MARGLIHGEAREPDDRARTTTSATSSQHAFAGESAPCFAGGGDHLGRGRLARGERRRERIAARQRRRDLRAPRRAAAPGPSQAAQDHALDGRVEVPAAIDDGGVGRILGVLALAAPASVARVEGLAPVESS